MRKKILVLALAVGFQVGGYAVETTGQVAKTSPFYDYIQQQQTPPAAPAPSQAVLSESAAPAPLASAPQEEHGLFGNLKSLKEKIVATASKYLGMRYAFGAARGGDKTDCSLFAQRVFDKFGVNLPRSAAEQSHLGTKVSKANLQPGDLLFYRTYKKAPSHVAIYIGDGKMIHASYRDRKVVVDTISKGYYQKRFLFAKRVALPTEKEKAVAN